MLYQDGEWREKSEVGRNEGGVGVLPANEVAESGSVEIGKLEEYLSVGVWFEFVCFLQKAKGLTLTTYYLVFQRNNRKHNSHNRRRASHCAHSQLIQNPQLPKPPSIPQFSKLPSHLPQHFFLL
jgi:hypothetical protein